MRGLTSTPLLLLAPAIVLAAATPLPATRAPSSSALVELVTLEDAEGAPSELSFHLEILPSAERCGHPSLTINGQPLPTGRYGQFIADDDVEVATTWKSQCADLVAQSDPVHVLDFRIESVNRKHVENLALTVRFSQSGQPTILDVTGTADLTAVRYFANGDEADAEQANAAGHSVLEELNDLAILQSQADELQDIISERRAWLKAAYGWPASERAPKCETLVCHARQLPSKLSSALASVMGKVDAQTEASQPIAILGSRPPWREADHPQPPYCKFPPSKEADALAPPDPVNSTNGTHSTSPATAIEASPSKLMASLMLPLATLGILLVGFVVFLHVRCFNSRRFKAWAERRAARRARREAMRNAIHDRLNSWRRHRDQRRHARRQAIKAFFSNLLCHIFHRRRLQLEDEEKAGMLSFYREAQREQQQGRQRSASLDSETTMADELASFRSVVDVVDQLISGGDGEKGRGREARISLEAQRSRGREQAIARGRVQTHSPHGTFAQMMPRRSSFESEDLPPYKDYESDDGEDHVSDGFSNVGLHGSGRRM